MTPEQLKASILQYAMEGKLVPQKIKDRSIFDVIEKKSEERKEKIKNKEMRNEKISPIGFPIVLPRNWYKGRLLDIAVLKNGSVKRGPFGSSITKSMFVESSDNTYKVYEQGNAIRQDIYYGNYNITKKDFEKLKGFEVYPGDIIISCAGTIGKTFELPTDAPRGIINQALMKVKIDEKVMLKSFFLYSFENVVKQINKDSIGSAMKNLASLKYLKNEVIFPIPPIEEQQRIVETLDELLPLIEDYGEAYKELEKLNTDFPKKMEQSLLQYAMEGKLVPQISSEEPAKELLKRIHKEKEELITEGKIKKEKALPTITEEEKPFDIPDTWEWVRLGDISRQIKYGYTASASEKGNSKMLRITDIQNGKVDWQTVPFCEITKDKLNGLQLETGDILIARTGGTIGKSFLVNSVEEVSVFASYLIRVQLIDINMSKYINKFLNSPMYWEQLTGITFGTGQPNVNAKNLSNLRIPVPPLEEQKRIIEAIENSISLLV